MKFAYLAILPFLTGCTVAKSDWQAQIDKDQEEIDTSSEVTVLWLKEQGYNQILITGNRTEDCNDDHALIGHGVIVKALENTDKPVPISGVVCIDWNGLRSFEVDAKNE